MVYQHNTPTFNVNRKVVNFKDFDPKKEKEELKKIKKSFTKNDLSIGQRQQKSRYNRVTHKNDYITSDFVDDAIEAVEESNSSTPTLKGWCFWDNGMHPVEFSVVSEKGNKYFSARADGEIWDLSTDPQDFIEFIDDRVYTKKDDRGDQMIFSEACNLEEWVENNFNNPF